MIEPRALTSVGCTPRTIVQESGRGAQPTRSFFAVENPTTQNFAFLKPRRVARACSVKLVTHGSEFSHA
jgi:hypothetical protein